MTAQESMISTHARNFPGRNGNPEAKMYLASALTVTAAAVAGKIADPRQYV
jgi:3-isopropylmalate/(R)-2-methylmalate dehydratase large subunit